MRRWIVTIALAALAGACAVIPGNWHAHQNQKGPGKPTMANLQVGDEEQRDGLFVGIAISGGGFRAANFGAATLLELKKLGLLDRADFVSSVSGGSLAAAFLALDGHEYATLSVSGRISFEEHEIKNLLGRDIQIRYAARWFLPWNILRYWFTNFTRTDIMFDALDANLFHGATYADLKKDRPKLLINASAMGDPQRFVFTDETLHQLGSDLASYRISAAVTASAAVPGFFHRVVLQDYSEAGASQEASFIHLSDAAVTDNLGLLTLLDVLRISAQYKTDVFPKGCVLISIDASPTFHNSIAHRLETRMFPEDYIIDRNASEAVDFILLDRRRDTLALLGIRGQKLDREALSDFPFPEPGRGHCRFWHIALRHIPPMDELGIALTRIPSEFNIRPDQQEALFRAARLLVRKGWEAGASDWINP